jgi:undecaprenyl diphosphate synthase
MSLKDELVKGRIPKHVAIIMDGNGRWAQEKGEDRVFGHISGVHSVREALTAATAIGVKYLTLYTFSTENWNRPKEEIDALMDLLVRTIASEVESLNENGVRLKTIGDTSSLPQSCLEALDEAINQTSKNTKVTLILALSYSSRTEIESAIKKIVTDVQEKKVVTHEINEKLISSYLSTAEIPDPDLLIRTSGEIRISNFLLWQIAYSELYFTETLWPDFKEEDFFKAILEYQNRERRFGKTSAQIIENE